MNKRVRAGLNAGLIHLLISVLVAALIAVSIFFLWFPSPYREMINGGQLFLLIIAVDVICGPLLTAIVFDPRKKRKELFRDLLCICCIQISALGFGAYTIFQARPVLLAFEVDRLRLVTYADIKKEDLRPSINSLHHIPWTGVSLIGTRMPENGTEMLESLELSMRGYDPAFRPNSWVPYVNIADDIRIVAQPISNLLVKNPEKREIIDVAIKKSKSLESELVWLPVTSYKSMDWIALIRRIDLQPVVFLHMNGF
ncbi:MAG: hypothetical protein LBE61_05550 [Burkholderiaceae bacterium]|nr:hypothetical protein [Burkholderiaceae bacterium]